jgi:hypothetical protein
MHSSNHLELCYNHTTALEHNWSQTRDSRLSTAQTTVKVNCNLRSQKVYVTAAPSRVPLDTSRKVSTAIGSKDNGRMKEKRNADSKH